MLLMNPDVLIEAFLFYKGSAQSKTTIATALGLTGEELTPHIEVLRARLQSGATTLVETEQELQLVTIPTVAPFLEAVRRDDLRADIGKAGAETLAIILYREPVSRAEIDRIRGVNSAVTLRNLLTRGLIARSPRASAQGYMYTITPQVLTHLGVEQKQTLPEYGAIMDRLDTFISATEAEAVAT